MHHAQNPDLPHIGLNRQNIASERDMHYHDILDWIINAYVIFIGMCHILSRPCPGCREAASGTPDYRASHLPVQ